MSRFERQDAQAASAALAEGLTQRSTAVANQARRRRGVRLPAWLRPHQFSSCTCWGCWASWHS